jgi:hypothetical protein
MGKTNWRAAALRTGENPSARNWELSTGFHGRCHGASRTWVVATASVPGTKTPRDALGVARGPSHLAAGRRDGRQALRVVRCRQRRGSSSRGRRQCSVANSHPPGADNAGSAQWDQRTRTGNIGVHTPKKESRMALSLALSLGPVLGPCPRPLCRGCLAPRHAAGCGGILTPIAAAVISL